MLGTLENLLKGFGFGKKKRKRRQAILPENDAFQQTLLDLIKSSINNDLPNCSNPALNCQSTQKNLENTISLDQFTSYYQENLCQTDPCQNGGDCVYQTSGTRVCECKDGYEGENCEILVRPDFCQTLSDYDYGEDSEQIGIISAPVADQQNILDFLQNGPNYDKICNNNGICNNKNTNFECSCLPGFTGNSCEIDMFCQTANTENLCQNGSICDNASCICETGFYGEFCQFEDFCVMSQCQNGGVCRNEVAGPICLCEDGFYGTNCQFKNKCDAEMDAKCGENGVCQNLEIEQDGKMTTEATCKCYNGYSGQFCDILPVNSEMNKCENGMYGEFCNISKQNWLCDVRYGNNQ